MSSCRCFAALAVLIGAAGLPLRAQAPARPPVPGAPMGVTAIVNVAVIPMDTERVLLDQTVLVERGWIVALGPSDQVPAPAGAMRIDGRGRYLIPGLGDMHAHLNGNRRILIQWLAAGVTTIRVMDFQIHGSQAEQNLILRAQAAAGELQSPRIYTSAAWYVNNQDYGGDGTVTWTIAPGDIARRIAAYQAKGFDFVKPYRESPEVFDSMVAAAHRLGLPVAGHVPTGVPLSAALAHMKSIEHLTGLQLDGKRGAEKAPVGGLSWNAGPAEIAALAGRVRRAGVWNTPTVAIMDSGYKLFRSQIERARPGNSVESLSRRQHQLIKALHDSGAGLLLGTDTPWDRFEPGPAVHNELAALVEKVGLTPYQALLTGTRNVAAYFGTLDRTGTVTVGKRADLALLNSNPLADIRHTRRLAGVMLGGRWLSWEELDRRLTGGPGERKEYFGRYANEAYAGEFIAPLRERLRRDSSLALTREQRSPLSARHAAQREALVDSLVTPDSLASAAELTAARRRLLQLVAAQLGEMRAVLTSPQRAVFDSVAAAWRQRYAAEGHYQTIPGVAHAAPRSRRHDQGGK